MAHRTHEKVPAVEPVRNERRVAAGHRHEVLTGGGESGHDQCREGESEMVLDAVCDDNGVESVQLCSWWSNGVNERSSVVLMDVKGASINERFKASAAVGSRFSRLGALGTGACTTRRRRCCTR